MQLRRKIIRSKPFLYKLYCRWYLEIAAALPTGVKGPLLELGTGAGFLKDFIPGLITSDYLDIRSVDLTLDGCFLPIKDNCLKALVMVDVFHHLPDADLFLRESARCVKAGGFVIMIEPWITAWSRPIYRYAHHEPLEQSTPDWRLPPGGPLSGANSALPWIVFQRDRKRLAKKFSNWQVHEIRLHTPFSYLLSGGVSYRSFIPGTLFEASRWIEKCFEFLMPRMAMFATIVLKNRGP